MPTVTTTPKRRQRLLLAVGGCAFALALAELAVRATGLAREVGPSFTEWHATDGVHVRRSISVTRSTREYTMRFTSNADGYRGPELPPKIGRSLLFLGDSFTMGYGVDDGQEFPARLAKRIPTGWTVVNAGIGGTGNGRWLHVLRREHARLQPAVVVMQVCSNDLDDNVAEGLFALDEAGALLERAPAPPTLARQIQGCLDRVPGASYLHLLGLGRQLGAKHRPASLPAAAACECAEADHAARLQCAILREAVRLVRAMKAQPVLLSADLPPDQFRQMEQAMAELDVPLVRIPSRAERPDLYFPMDGHWLADGHAFVAEQLGAELSDPRYGLGRL